VKFFFDPYELVIQEPLVFGQRRSAQLAEELKFNTDSYDELTRKKEIAVDMGDFELAAQFRNLAEKRKLVIRSEGEMNQFILRIQGKGKYSLLPFADRATMLSGVVAQYVLSRSNGGNVVFTLDKNYKPSDRYEMSFSIFDGETLIAPRFAGGKEDELDKLISQTGV